PQDDRLEAPRRLPELRQAQHLQLAVPTQHNATEFLLHEKLKAKPSRLAQHKKSHRGNIDDLRLTPRELWLLQGF
ncbi:MAG: hypothetical protein WCF50_12835, partial [Pseudolabrys sp.]